jgi:glycine/D-amino acid oxidase-like deaminating enzyme
MTADIILVGQGICGSLLSRELLNRGMRVKVYDTAVETSATYAASGIINPITGKRFVKSWLTDTVIPAAEAVYADLSRTLGVQIYESLPIYKLLYSIKEQNDIAAREADEGYAAYLRSEPVYLVADKVINPFGAFIIHGGGRVDVQRLLLHYRRFLKDHDVLVEEEFTYEQALNSNIPVVFCNGYRAAREGVFDQLEWQIVKGEYLLVRIPDFYADRIVSGDTTLSPTSEPDVYYAGATYQWHYDTVAPTATYRAEIEESLRKTIALPYEVLHHGAGIRPSVKHRRPFIGFHATYKHIGIFNGMGTKGMSLSPYFAAHFADHIVHHTPLMPEIDIAGLSPKTQTA